MGLLLAMLLLALPPARAGAPDGRRAAVPPPFRSGQKVFVVGLDMTAQSARYWRPDLEIEQRAAAEFKKQKLFRVVAYPSQADFVFEIVYDQSSDDFAEAAVALRPADYGAGGNSLEALRAVALWSGLSHQHFFLKSPWLRWGASSSAGLVKQFCRAVKGAGGARGRGGL